MKRVSVKLTTGVAMIHKYEMAENKYCHVLRGNATNNLCVLDLIPRFIGYSPRGITIKMDLREIGWDGVDWSDMPQDRDQ
jgi:hypothetical protein